MSEISDVEQARRFAVAAKSWLSRLYNRMEECRRSSTKSFADYMEAVEAYQRQDELFHAAVKEWKELHEKEAPPAPAPAPAAEKEVTMPKIRTITDPQELTLAQLDDIRAGNERTRNEIKRLRGLLKGGLKEEERLEQVRLAVAKTDEAQKGEQ